MHNYFDQLLLIGADVCLNHNLSTSAGRAAYVPGAAVDTETAEACAAGSGLYRSGDPAGDVQVGDGRL